MLVTVRTLLCSVGLSIVFGGASAAECVGYDATELRRDERLARAFSRAANHLLRMPGAADLKLAKVLVPRHYQFSKACGASDVIEARGDLLHVVPACAARPSSSAYLFRICALRTVQIAVAPIRRKDVILADSIGYASLWMPAAHVPVQLAPHEIDGQYRSKLHIAAGRALSREMIEKVEAVQPGDRLTAVVAQGRVSIQMPVRVLTPGYVGGAVKVRTGHGLVLNGVIDNPDLVKIETR